MRKLVQGCIPGDVKKNPFIFLECCGTINVAAKVVDRFKDHFSGWNASSQTGYAKSLPGLNGATMLELTL